MNGSSFPLGTNKDGDALKQRVILFLSERLLHSILILMQSYNRFDELIS